MSSLPALSIVIPAYHEERRLPAALERLAEFCATFAEVAEVWARRTSERAQSVVIGLFPAWAVEPSTVHAADDWLADDAHPPALRRLVAEGRAGIVRALGAREFDRS